MKFLITFIFLFRLSNSFCQNQEKTLIVYNVAFGAVTSGVGSAINKHKSETWSKAFLRGMWQGSIGGALHYSGKKTLYLINKNQNNLYAWPAKILHSAGNSIVESAARNQPFLKNWNMSVGPCRFDFSLAQNKFFKARLLPFAFYGIYAGSKKGKFNLKTSARTGAIVFESKGFIYNQLIGFTLGESYGRAIIVSKLSTIYLTRNRVLAHELVHTFQFDEYQIFNSWFKPFESKIDRKWVQKLFTKYVCMDIPYFLTAYEIAGSKPYPNYYKNFYEFEAERFATGLNVSR